MSDSDDENPKPAQNGQKGRKGQRKQDTFIREGSEDPVDLLDQNAFSHVSTNKPVTEDEEFRRRAKAASRASTFKSGRDGRMIIEEPDPTPPKNQTTGPEYNAYEEMQESNDMAKRGYRDRVKFSNKRSHQDAEDFDVEMTDAYAEQKTPPKKKFVKFDGRKKGFQKRRPIQ
jgi:ribosomal RNA-processing protein 12